MPKKFQRKIEDFICKNCGTKVKGGGYTNHCPDCLWSRHVDINPGDRLSECGGMMEPIGIDQKKGNYIILHKCIKCGYEKRNRTAEGDDFDAILKVAGELRN
ncbi:MAG: RNHCP domain-containing protein [Parcubacteria group bacterium]|jgi:ribosomal protein L37AE/L43A|nr:RNHCP domain-containing protein [Candidatus Moranbacteria bacterium]